MNKFCEIRSLIALLVIFVSSTSSYAFVEIQDMSKKSVKIVVYSDGDNQVYFASEEKSKVNWNLVIACLTFLTAVIATYSVIISRKSFIESIKPVVVWSGIDNNIFEVNQIYLANIIIGNYGSGIAHIREVSSKLIYI